VHCRSATTCRCLSGSRNSAAMIWIDITAGRPARRGRGLLASPGLLEVCHARKTGLIEAEHAVGVPGAARHGGARNRQAPRNPIRPTSS
jgi:hypothetical protein